MHNFICRCLIVNTQYVHEQYEAKDCYSQGTIWGETMKTDATGVRTDGLKTIPEFGMQPNKETYGEPEAPEVVRKCRLLSWDVDWTIGG